MLELEINEISITQLGFSVLLKPNHEERVVPIFIGPFETFSISSALENKKIERPITHDLTKNIIKALGSTVNKIIINDFKKGTFFAELHLEVNQNKKVTTIHLDSRPSDAIALAIRFKAPIFIEEKVYTETSIDINLLNQKSQETEAVEDLFFDELLDLTEEEFLSKTLKDKTPQEQTVAKSNKTKLLSESDVLQQMLKTAIQKEDYKEAAHLRDELKKIINKKK